MNTDTPLTNSATFEIRTKNLVPKEVVPTSMARKLERELLTARNDNFNLANALSKAEAEVKLRQGVYAAALREWKIDAQRLSELDAEQRQWLENREKSTFQNWIDRAEKAEAEVERLKENLEIAEENLASLRMSLAQEEKRAIHFQHYCKKAQDMYNYRLVATSEADERAEKGAFQTNQQMTTTDTPRTDACPHCGSPRISLLCAYFTCEADTTQRDEDKRTHLCREREKSQKLEAEVERLKELVNESIFEKSNLSIALVNCQADLRRAIHVARMLPVIPIPAISSRDITDTLYAELNQLEATLNPTE